MRSAPFDKDPFRTPTDGDTGGERSGDADVPAGSLEPSTEADVRERLVADGAISHGFGDGETRIEVRTVLTGNHREWKFRVSVKRDGRALEDDLGAFPLQRRIPRRQTTGNPFGDDEDEAGRRNAARAAAHGHLEACERARGLIPEAGSKGRRWPWVLAGGLVLLVLGVGTGYYLWTKGQGLFPVIDCTAEPAHSECPQEPPDTSFIDCTKQPQHVGCIRDTGNPDDPGPVRKNGNGSSVKREDIEIWFK